MGALEDLTAAVEQMKKALEVLTEEVAGLREQVKPSREIFTLKDLAELPESPSLKTLRNHPERQPNGGTPDGYKGRERAWLRETVEAWRRHLSAEPTESSPIVRRKIA